MQGLAPSEIFLFEDFRLDRPGGGLLRCNGAGEFEPVAIGSRALDILGVLIERAGEVVSKEEIITAVWPRTVVEDSNLTVQISALRRALDKGRSGASCIQTVSGRGYRFIAPVAHPNADVLSASPEPDPGSEERRPGSALSSASSTRRLAAILALNVAGYSRLMGADEEGTHERLKAYQRELAEPKLREHGGRIVNTTGDGMLVEFPSVVDAVRCAAEMQRGMIDRELELPEEQRIKFRIGINLGDVIAEGSDIFGDGVNVAARLEALAEPGCIYISRVVRDQVRDRLDFAFEDLGDQQVKNLARPVRVYRVRDGALDVDKTIDVLTQPPPSDKPSIAVLPFANMSGDPEQEYFADGMVEEIITALSRIRWLFVIARNSSFTYKGQPIDLKQVGRELGVRYVLESSVRKAGSRVRIAAQLIEAQSGRHIWGDRFDGSLEGVFELQDKVAFSVAGVIEPALQSAETARLVARPTSDPTAYDLYLRAHAKHLSAGTQSGEALHLLEQAIRRDPQYGPALALAAFCHSRLYTGGHSPVYMGGRREDPEANKRKATAFARRALAVAGDDPAILANVAYALAYIGEDLGAMMALIDRALALNPSFARGWYISGVLRLWAGQPDIAIEHAERSLRLSPRERVGGNQLLIAAAYFYSRRFEKAVPKFLLAMQEDPSATDAYRALAACYAHMGQIDEAREVIARLRTITPRVMPNLIRLSNPEHRELYLSGLRLAAGEEPST